MNILPTLCMLRSVQRPKQLRNVRRHPRAGQAAQDYQAPPSSHKYRPMPKNGVGRFILPTLSRLSRSLRERKERER